MGKPKALQPLEYLERDVENFEQQCRMDEDRQREKAKMPALAAGWTIDQTFALESILHELRARESEALAIYSALPGIVGFHESIAGEIGIVGSNRAGKSIAAGAEVARAVTGRHPIPEKYPAKDGEFALIGPNEKHLRLLYAILFLPGAFKVLRTTNGYVVPRYDNPEHVARIRDWEPSPPLIPSRMLADEPAWLDKKAGIPAIIRLVNGWTMNFFSFESEPPRGVAWNGAWLDEESPRARKWLSEVRARLMSRKGYLIWSATPESATATFYGMQTRANRPDMADKPPYARTEFYSLHSKDNPYLDPESREAFIERITEDDPDAATAKVEGDWAFKKYLVYPEWDDNVHCIDPFPIEWNDTVYCIIDPSRSRCGILLVAVLSPNSPHYLEEQPDRIICFDERIIKNCNAFKAAQAMAEMVKSHKHWIEHIIIDWHHGRKRLDNDDRQIAEVYWEEIKAAGVEPRLDRFEPGYDNLKTGIERVSQALVPKNGLPPKLAVFRGKCPWLVWEFHRYARIKTKDASGRDIPGEPTKKGNDLVDCCRYAVNGNLKWVTPPGKELTKDSYSAEELREIDRNPKKWMYQAMGFLKPRRK